MSKSRIFLALSLSFILGIFLSSFSNLEKARAYFFFLPVFSIILLAVFWKNKGVLIVASSILFLACGLFLTEKRLSEIRNLDKEGQEFFGEVLVVREPENRGQFQSLIVQASPKLRFLISAPSFPRFFYGDKLEIRCQREIPRRENEKFDYRMYLAKDRIFYVCRKSEVKLLEREQGFYPYFLLLKVKSKVERGIKRLFPSPESGLLSGLLLGGSGNLSEGVKNNFSRTGLTHIVAVSGYNVTIIAEYLMLFGFFIGLWRQKAFWFAVSGISLFVLMIGLPSSAVRAGIMGTLLLWAAKNGRLSNSQNAIIFSALVMLLFNPLLLRWDTGFQLSFLATLGIIYLFPLLEKRFQKREKTLGLGEILLLTLSAQIFVWPVIIYSFGNLSLISPFANLLILPIVPLTMLLGFLAVASFLIFPPLGTLLSWLAFLPLKYETLTVAFLSRLPFSNLSVESFSWLWVVAWYLGLALILIQLKKKKCPKEKQL